MPMERHVLEDLLEGRGNQDPRNKTTRARFGMGCLYTGVWAGCSIGGQHLWLWFISPRAVLMRVRYIVPGGRIKKLFLRKQQKLYPQATAAAFQRPWRQYSLH
jgi:hypothetical protein